jgi:homoserine kinase type II
MTTHPTLDRRELSTLSEDYGLGKVLSAIPADERWGRRGSQHQSVVLDTARGRVIVRLDEVKGELDVKREIDLLLYLRKHGFPCPQPLADRKGRYYREVGGACLFAHKHIDGRQVSTASLTATQIENIGRVLADLHIIGKGYKKGIDNRFSFERVADLYVEVRERLPGYFKKITRTLDDETEYLGNYLEGKLPKGVIHGDLVRDNLLLKGEKLVAVLGFEAACRGKFIFDLATAVNAVCFTEGRYDLKRFESLIAGYESLRTLSLAEWDAFPNELRFSALRFTVTRLRDLLALPGADRGLAAITEERVKLPAAAENNGGPGDERARVTKGFQEFYERLCILRRERDGGMEAMLLAMATGYDYRKYQKVKAIEKKGSK